MPYQKRRKVSITFDPTEGLTQQEFKAECNINAIMAKYQKTGVVNHISKYSPTYGDYAPIDFQEAQNTIIEGQRMFDELPSSVRKRFQNDPAEFMAFVQDPDNLDELRDMGLAIPKPEAPQAPETPDPVHTPTDPS